MKIPMAACALLLASGVMAAPASFEQRLDLSVDGTRWLGTVHTPLDESSDDLRNLTNKVYTHVYDFDGEDRITKGPVGQYCHHRGLFIGWNHTNVGETRYDTWHMSDSSQEHVRWHALEAAENGARQVQEIHWKDANRDAIIREMRTIEAKPGNDGLRIIDFTSELTALNQDIALRGDLQHAGMQIRLHEEITDHQESTEYTLQPGGEELDDDKVVGAWWVVCSAVVDGKRYWVAHMTPPDHPTGEPVYSIRRYARFGAFFEPDLKQDEPQTFTFRILVSDKPITAEMAAGHYEAYSAE